MCIFNFYAQRVSKRRSEGKRKREGRAGGLGGGLLVSEDEGANRSLNGWIDLVDCIEGQVGWDALPECRKLIL